VRVHLKAEIAIVALALLLRVLYIAMAQVSFPIRGDTNQYVLYGWNLAHRGTFSRAMPEAADVTPDSYRAPGYPAVIAAAMMMAGHSELPMRPAGDGLSALGYESDTWMTIVLGTQAVLGAATVWLVLALGRMWLRPKWAIAVGTLAAIWPHLITFAGTLLSETLFAFVLLLALWMLARAARSRLNRTYALAGGAFGIACLVNPIVGLFPLVAAVPIALRERRGALVFLVSFALLPAAWAVRNATLATGAGSLERLEQNFVEGSWPEYHDAYNRRSVDPIARAFMSEIASETQALAAVPAEGLERIGERLASHPWSYARWYLLEKPYLLWGWRIRIGAGDVSYLSTQHSPFQRIPLLKLVKQVCRLSNPFLFALAAFAAFAALIASWRRQVPQPLLFTALLAVYLTAVHVVLQAEPRYAIPYRPEEFLLAATALAWIAAAIATWRANSKSGVHTATPIAIVSQP
jgi:4-amino-4-deoxy-L-arabinose transferase-like glycosyltransferase